MWPITSYITEKEKGHNVTVLVDHQWLSFSWPRKKRRTGCPFFFFLSTQNDHSFVTRPTNLIQSPFWLYLARRLDQDPSLQLPTYGVISGPKIALGSIIGQLPFSCAETRGQLLYTSRTGSFWFLHPMPSLKGVPVIHGTTVSHKCHSEDWFKPQEW